MVGRSILLAGMGVLLCAPRASSRELPEFEEAAARLQAAVVTVRVAVYPAPGTPAKPAQPGPRPIRVSVGSGVSLGDGLIVAPIHAVANARIRITIPGGDQATARIRVIDEYSGLSLLESSARKLPGLKPAAQSPRVGSWVLSASAWGAERPVVSLGVVSGLQRDVAEASYPPLLQCDLRTTETSSGGAIVDAKGQLLGIVVLAESANQRRGWTYAVPVTHIRRLVRTLETRRAPNTSVTILKRRRPTVGMVLDSRKTGVFVTRVTPGSPAEKAGIQVGDRLLATNDIKIRSVYQALRPVLLRQPGDEVTFAVLRSDKALNARVVLGGGVELPSAQYDNLSGFVQPKIDIESGTQGIFRAKNGAGVVREVYDPGDLDISADPASDSSKIEVLEKALDRYQRAIVYLQDQLKQRSQQQLRDQELIKALELDIRKLRERK